MSKNRAFFSSFSWFTPFMMRLFGLAGAATIDLPTKTHKYTHRGCIYYPEEARSGEMNEPLQLCRTE